MDKVSKSGSANVSFSMVQQEYTDPLVGSESCLEKYLVGSKIDVADIDALPPASSIFEDYDYDLAAANDTGQVFPIFGVHWILPPVIGISYKKVGAGYSLCMRVVVVDVVCCQLNEDILSAHLPVDVVFAKADMEVGMDLKKKELFWHGTACYRGFDTAWKWRCADGRGCIIRF